MALFQIVSGFTYRPASGPASLYVNVEHPSSPENLFDTLDPARNVPPGWVPPATGLEPLDQEAKLLIDQVRANYCGRQLPGVAKLLCDTPIWSPP